MGKIKNILMTGVLALGVFGAITFTACKKSDDATCPTGYYGAKCDSMIRLTYAGDYKGTGSDNAGGTYTNWTLSFSPSGSSATDMTLVLKNTAGATQLTFPIVLTFGAAATTYTVTSTTVGAFTYTGSGTISSTNASLLLNQAGTPNLAFTFSNFVRQ